MIDDIGIISGGLIIHTPSSIEEFKATILNEITDNVASGFLLKLPPFRKVDYLNVNESIKYIFNIIVIQFFLYTLYDIIHLLPIFIEDQLMDDIVKNFRDGNILDVVP